MKLKILTAALVPMLFSAGCHMFDGPKAAAPVVDEAEMMAKWMEYATPGKEHERLAHKIGRWTMRVVSFMPGGATSESLGQSEMKWTLDGRFVQDTTEGDMGGMPFHGRGLTGYDKIKQKYVSTWVDNMMTGIIQVEGTYDSSTKSFTYVGQMPDPMSGAYVPTRQVERVIDTDHFVFEMYVSDARGAETKQMEIHYTRWR